MGIFQKIVENKIFHFHKLMVSVFYLAPQFLFPHPPLCAGPVRGGGCLGGGGLYMWKLPPKPMSSNSRHNNSSNNIVLLPPPPQPTARCSNWRSAGLTQRLDAAVLTQSWTHCWQDAYTSSSRHTPNDRAQPCKFIKNIIFWHSRIRSPVLQIN